jgi:hypothetical protein
VTTDAEALNLPPREAMRFFAGKVNVGTQRWDDVWKAGHTRAFMVAGVQADDVLQGVRGALDKAIRDGTTLAEFRRDLGPLMQRLGWEAKGKGYAAWRTRLVYETNLRSSYAAGQYEQQTDPDVLALVPIWRYRHSGALDPRPEHVRWDGLTLRHDDAWWTSHYPPNGWGCGCWVEPLTERQAARGAGKGGRNDQGLHQAPEILRRSWTDPASGRTDMVPLGIDPGWDYNVGAAWRIGTDLPAPSAPVPTDWPPASPSLPPPAPRPAPASRRAPEAPIVSPGAPRATPPVAAVDGTDVLPVFLPSAPAQPDDESIRSAAQARAALLARLAALTSQAEAEAAAQLNLDDLRHRVQAIERRANSSSRRRRL